MVQGSLIDTEYKGISTIEIMNYISPDVIALGNHEFDYGLPHLLFLEKMANFPKVKANLYIKQYNKRLMQSHLILKKTGFDSLLIGIITEKVMDSLKQDELISSFVSLEETSKEIEKICDAFKNDNVDLTIILTHIGFDFDLELAKLISPEAGVENNLAEPDPKLQQFIRHFQEEVDNKYNAIIGKLAVTLIHPKR